MHELAITRNIVAIAAEAAQGRRVLGVTVEIGKLSGVHPDAVALCFEIVAEGTPLQGAKLDIRQIPGRARCKECGGNFETPTIITRCYHCGSHRLLRLSGEELNVRSMEVEEVADV